MLPPFPTEEILTGADLETMTAGLRGEMAELRGEMGGDLARDCKMAGKGRAPLHLHRGARHEPGPGAASSTGEGLDQGGVA